MVRLLEPVQREETMTVAIEERVEILGNGLPVTRQDLDNLKARIGLMKEFVSKQLRMDVDYGTIPGTPKPCLYQPGAQKLARLFGLTVRKECTHREVDRETNFAMFTYKATVYVAKNDTVIAECEGSCNSQEKKYANRRNRGVSEETPVTDILNTLQKMAQKRAFVGAVIEACAASDFFTQDIDSPEEAEALGMRPAPARATVQVPKPVSAHRRDQSNVENCDACGHQMMVSTFNQGEWYCNTRSGGCGAKKPREV